MFEQVTEDEVRLLGVMDALTEILAAEPLSAVGALVATWFGGVMAVRRPSSSGKIFLR
jgi:hypothetical protein